MTGITSKLHETRGYIRASVHSSPTLWPLPSDIYHCMQVKAWPGVPHPSVRNVRRLGGKPGLCVHKREVYKKIEMQISSFRKLYIYLFPVAFQQQQYFSNPRTLKYSELGLFGTCMVSLVPRFSCVGAQEPGNEATAWYATYR